MTTGCFSQNNGAYFSVFGVLGRPFPFYLGQLRFFELRCACYITVERSKGSLLIRCQEQRSHEAGNTAGNQPKQCGDITGNTHTDDNDGHSDDHGQHAQQSPADKAEGKAEAILELLGELGDVSEELKTLIFAQQDLEVLGHWLKLAARAENVQEFAEKIKM